MKHFDLFIVEGVETFVNVEYIVEKVKESIGSHVEIRYLTLDDNSCVFRNFTPGSISLIAYINNSEYTNFKTGYQKIQVTNNGICVYSNNFDVKYHPSIEEVIDEDTIINRIISAFNWTISTCYTNSYDIIGDGYKYISDILNNYKINN